MKVKTTLILMGILQLMIALLQFFSVEKHLLNEINLICITSTIALAIFLIWQCHKGVVVDEEGGESERTKLYLILIVISQLALISLMRIDSLPKEGYTFGFMLVLWMYFECLRGRIIIQEGRKPGKPAGYRALNTLYIGVFSGVIVVGNGLMMLASENFHSVWLQKSIPLVISLAVFLAACYITERYILKREIYIAVHLCLCMTWGYFFFSRCYYPEEEVIGQHIPILWLLGFIAVVIVLLGIALLAKRYYKNDYEAEN